MVRMLSLRTVYLLTVHYIILVVIAMSGHLKHVISKAYSLIGLFWIMC